MLYENSRLLLAVVPPHAPEALRFTGMVLYVVAPAATVGLVVSLLHVRRQQQVPLTGYALLAAIMSVIVLAAYAIRFGVSAYHYDSLVMVNNVAVHVFYFALLVFLALLTRIARTLSDQTGTGARRFVQYFTTLQLVGLYLYGIAILAFWVTGINVYIRLVDLGIVTVLFSVVLILHVESTPKLGGSRFKHRVLRHVSIVTMVFAGISASTIVLRETDVLPHWIDPVLIAPVYAITVSMDLALRMTHSSRPLAIPAENRHEPRKRAQEVFFARLIDEYRITRQEARVLELVMLGKSNGSIANYLGITEKTVRNHVSSLYHKTQAKNRVELVHVFELP